MNISSRGRLLSDDHLAMKITNCIHNNSIQVESLILWVLLIAAFLVCYFDTFKWLHYKYQLQDSYYSHGYIIPLFSAYMIFRKRWELRKYLSAGTSIGLGLIVFALGVHFMGTLADINFVSGFSMVIYLMGSCLYLKGFKFTRAIGFPLFLLFFMCPIPDAIIDVVALPFKSMATSLSLSMIDLIGIPNFRDGFRIILPNSSYLVGTPCNGMRSLISFLALGLFFVHFTHGAWWKKNLFLIAVLPLSVFLNGVRIAVLLLIAYYYGQEAASPESYLHDGSGFLVLFFGLSIMIWTVRRFDNEK